MTPVPTRPRIVAHRGASATAPENTVAAFRHAWELGVESVELDMHLTRDGEVVVMHDPTTKRTAGVELVIAKSTLAELQALDVGRWKSPAYAGERIPTIADALATIPSGRTMFLEIKPGADTAPAIARAIRAADPRPRGGQIAIQGFDARAITALGRELPGVPVYWTVDPPVEGEDQILPYPLAILDEAVQHGFAGIALYHGATSDALVDKARAAGLLVDVWTLNEPAELAHWATRDVRWIETDRPDLVARQPR